MQPGGLGGQSELSPPLINTVPSGSSVAAWLSRCLDMLAVEMNFSVTGSYSSELANRPAILVLSTRQQYFAGREQSRSTAINVCRRPCLHEARRRHRTGQPE